MQLVLVFLVKCCANPGRCEVFLLLKVSILPLATILFGYFGTVPIVSFFFVFFCFVFIVFFILSLLSLKEIDSNRRNENM